MKKPEKRPGAPGTMTPQKVLAVHRRLARFTAKRQSIPPGDGRCVRQTSSYVVATEEIFARRCTRKEGHQSPHRFRAQRGAVPFDLPFKKKV